MSFLKKILGIEKKRGLVTYKRGIQHFNRLEYEKAILDFEKILAEKTLANSLEANLAKFYCGRAYINVGITEFARNNSSEALGYFQKAKAFNPKDTDLHYFIGICQNNVGKYQEAMDSFTKIMETEPWNIPTKLKIAIIFHNMKMWKNAEEIHRAILEKHPGFADVHYHLGLSLMSQGKPEAAAESFSKALTINPDYTEARLKLSMVQICMDRLDKAEDNLTIISRRYPQYADVHYLLALIKEKINDLPKATHHLNLALDISPQFKNALVKQIIICCRTDDKAAAQAKIEKALTFYPQDNRFLSIQKALKIFEPEYNSGQDSVNQRMVIDLEDEYLIKELRNEFHRDLDIMPNVSEIISMFNNSRYLQEDSSLTEFLVPFITEQINRYPTYPDLYNSLGSQLLSAGKYLEAENAFAKALELNSDYVAARINLMKTLHKNKKYEEALAHGNELFPKDLPFPDVYYTLAEVQYHLKMYQEALINTKRVLRLRPGMNKVRLLMAKIYDKLGDEAATADMLRTFIKGIAEAENLQEAKQMLNDIESPKEPRQ